MNNKIALILLLLVNSFLFAQNKFEPGIVHYKNGNTEKGFIEFYNKSKTVVLFKRNLNDTPTKLTPKAVTSYVFDNLNKKIVSEKISTYKYEERYSTNNSDKKITAEVVNSTSYFLEILVEGKANLLFLDNNTNKKRYFLKSDKSGLKELDIVTRREKNSQTKNYLIKRYIGILSLEFNDCEILKSKIEKLRLTQSDLSKAFIQYNNCTGEITFESERLNRKNLHNLIIEAGLYSSKIKTRGTSLRGLDFDNSINPGFGIHYLYTPTALSSTVSLSIGATYNQIKTEAPYFRNFEVLIGNFRTTKIDLKTVNLRFGGIYNFNKSKKKINSNLGIYYINSIIINSDPFDAYSRITIDGTQSPLYSDFGVEMQRSTSGFALELGLNYQITDKNDLTARLGYERVGDFLNFFGASYPSNTFTLKLGYSFDL